MNHGFGLKEMKCLVWEGQHGKRLGRHALEWYFFHMIEDMDFPYEIGALCSLQASRSYLFSVQAQYVFFHFSRSAWTFVPFWFVWIITKLR